MDLAPLCVRLRFRRTALRHFGWIAALAGGLACALAWGRPVREWNLAGAIGLVLTVLLLGWVLERQFVAALRISRRPGQEILRWLLVLAAAFWVIRPYAGDVLIGAGDARHYAQQLADAIEQSRNGVFPILVGQSEYAFNGDFHPLRTAPYFQYAGVAADLVTGGALGPAGTQNLLIVASLLAAGLITYLCGLRIAGRRRAWIAALLAVAFASSPGVLALMYSGDMVATWMALPYLPLVALGLWRTLHEPNPAGGLLTASVAYAVVWLAHAPVALWLAPLFAICLYVRGSSGAPGKWRFAGIALGAGFLGLLLSLYVFVSTRTLGMPTDPNMAASVRAGAVTQALQAGWSNAFRGVTPDAVNLLVNLQLSHVLWCAAAVGIWGGWRLGAKPFALYFAFLLALLVPTPVADWLWKNMPDVVLGITDRWPSQRFYPILSALAPFLALAAMRHRRLSGPFPTAVAVSVLAAGCAFSLLEAEKFTARGRLVSRSEETSRVLLSPQNAIVSRYSYEYFGRLPRYFTGGVISPELQSRLLAPETLAVSVANRTNVLATASTSVEGQHPFLPDGTLSSPLQVEPGRSYLLVFEFVGSEPDGVLVLSGRTISREYAFNPMMESLAYRDASGTTRSTFLKAGDTAADELTARFFATDGRSFPANGSYLRLIQVEPYALPINVTGLIPFTATVTSAEGGWLETPKIFIPGYAAKVDGNSVSVHRSPDGLAMVQVPKGRHNVELAYPGTPAVRIAFWITAVAWVGLGFTALFCFRRRRDDSRSTALLWIGATGVATGLSCAAVACFTSTRGDVDSLASSREGEVASLKLQLPTDRFGWHEILASAATRAGELDLVVHYVDGQNVEFTLMRGQELLHRSGKVRVNYLLDHDLQITWGRQLPGRSPSDPRRHYRVVLDQAAVIDSLRDEQTRAPAVAARPRRSDRRQAAVPVTPQFTGTLRPARQK